VDPAAKYLHLDVPGRVRLWEKLYELGKTVPGIRDVDRARFEVYIAELRREAGDFDGSTQMFAAASHHTKNSSELRTYAEEIDKNKQLKIQLGAAPAIVRELYLLGRKVCEYERKNLADPKVSERMNEDVWFGREVRDERDDFVLINGLPLWRMTRHEDGVLIRTGPRTTDLRADDLRYEGTPYGFDSERKPPKAPMILASGMRGGKLTFKLTIDQSRPPADWHRLVKDPPAGGGGVGVLFGLNRLVGGIKEGAPAITIGYALTVAEGRARLSQILRDGEGNYELRKLADAPVAARPGKRPMEVTVDPGTVTVTLDGKRVSLPWKPVGDTAEGFAGFVFTGRGYATIEKPSITVR
jgi:hypothetical protein